MINVNDFKNGQTINYDGNLYQVLDFNHVKPGKGAAIVKAKLKNLRTGSIAEYTFNAGIKVPTAHVEKQKMQFLYADGDTYSFMNMETYEQIEIDKEYNISQIINTHTILSSKQTYINPIIPFPNFPIPAISNSSFIRWYIQIASSIHPNYL